MDKINDIYGERLDYPIEELMESIKMMLNDKLPFETDKSLKAWLMTPGAMADYYQEYTDVNIYRRPAYSDLIGMKKHINLYTSYMQRIISLLENESPFRISQYEGTLIVMDFLEDYYEK